MRRETRNGKMRRDQGEMKEEVEDDGVSGQTIRGEGAVTGEATIQPREKNNRQAHNAAERSVCGELCACGMLVQR